MMFNNNSSVSTMMLNTNSITNTATRKPPVGKPILSNTSLAYSSVEEVDTRTPPSLVCNSPSMFQQHKRQQHREALANITNSHEQNASSTNDLNKRGVATTQYNSNLKVNTNSTFNHSVTTVTVATTNSQCSKSFLNQCSATGKTNAAAMTVHSMNHSNNTSSNPNGCINTTQQQFNTSRQQQHHNTQHYTENQQTFEQQVESSPISSEQDPNAFNDFSMEASDEYYSSDEEMNESEEDEEEQEQVAQIDPDLFNPVDKSKLQSYMDFNIRNPVNLLPKSSLRTSTQTHLPIDVEDDILSYLFNAQIFKQVSTEIWQRTQKNVSAKMRTMLVEWIAGVAVSFKLLPETLFLSIDILDRFLCKVCVTNIKLLQGYGLACLFIAAKYCETIPPPLRQLLFAADNTYSRRVILALESEIYNAIDFELCSVQSYDFVEKFLELVGYDNNARIKCLTYYICELQLQNFDSLPFNKSTVALSSVIIALYVTGNTCSLGSLVACLGGSIDLEYIDKTNNCLMKMYNYYIQMSLGQIQHNFIKDKYARQSFDGVSTIGFSTYVSPSITF